MHIVCAAVQRACGHRQEMLKLWCHPVLCLGSLLDFLKSDEGCHLQLPKLIDFSAQVILTGCLAARSPCCGGTTVSTAELKGETVTLGKTLHCSISTDEAPAMRELSQSSSTP